MRSLLPPPLSRSHLHLHTPRVWAVVLLLAGFAHPAWAQWADDPAQNLTIADRPAGQAQPKLAPTDDGGFFVSWFGGGGDGFDVFLQRLDADGEALLEANGVRIADRSFSSTEDYGLAAAANGDAFVAFRFADGDGTPQAVASRTSPEGEPLWGTPGVFASDDASAAASPRVTATPDGGAVVAWTSFASGAIVLQKLDAAGAPQWGDGVSVTTPSGFFLIADLHADAEGNVIVSGSAQLSNFDRRLWAQKLAAADGSPLWGAEPVEVFDGSDGALQFGYFPPFVPDGVGGAVFAWYHVGAGTESRVRVQHVLADGSAAFPQNGVEAATGTDRQRSAPAAAYDEATGDIYVVWPEEQQVGSERTYGVAAQRIDAAGSRQWGDGGRLLVPLGDEQASQVSALPMGDGAVLAWTLGSAPAPMRIEAARLDDEGGFVWAGERVPVKTAETPHSRTRGALSTAGYAAYAWAEGESPAVIKAQNVNPDGTLGAAGTPQVAIDPAELAFSLFPDDVASATLTLSNLGAGTLTYAVSVARRDSVVVDFEDGTNPYDFTLGIPQIETIEPAGGNPGRWLRNAGLSTFIPTLYITEPPFTGDYVEQRVRSLRLDAQTVSASNTVEGRPFTLRLIRFNGEPDNPDAHDYVYYPGTLVPQPGEGWESYDFDIPSDFEGGEGELPEGWSGGYSGDLENLPPGVTWQDVLRAVDEVQLMWGHPAFFYLLQDFDLGVDNVRFAYAEAEPSQVGVTPTSGTVAAGASEELTVVVAPAGLATVVNVFDITVETNDPANPVLHVPVTVDVLPIVETEGGAVPEVFAVGGIYPNPFARTAALAFGLPADAEVEVRVYDVLGREVLRTAPEVLAAGTHTLWLEADGWASGVYVYRLTAEAAGRTYTASGRMTVAR